MVSQQILALPHLIQGSTMKTGKKIKKKSLNRLDNKDKLQTICLDFHFIYGPLSLAG